MASCVGGLTNPPKIADTFKSVKHSSISVDTIRLYLEYMEDAFVLERVTRYDIKGRKYIDSPFKYYFEDLGLRNARFGFWQVEPTHLQDHSIKRYKLHEEKCVIAAEPSLMYNRIADGTSYPCLENETSKL